MKEEPAFVMHTWRPGAHLHLPLGTVYTPRPSSSLYGDTGTCPSNYPSDTSNQIKVSLLRFLEGWPH